MIDPARATLVCYLADCIRAELRAKVLLMERRKRVRAAIQQIRDYDRDSVPTMEQMLAGARAAKRRNTARRRDG